MSALRGLGPAFRIEVIARHLEQCADFDIAVLAPTGAARCETEDVVILHHIVIPDLLSNTRLQAPSENAACSGILPLTPSMQRLV